MQVNSFRIKENYISRSTRLVFALQNLLIETAHPSAAVGRVFSKDCLHISYEKCERKMNFCVREQKPLYNLPFVFTNIFVCIFVKTISSTKKKRVLCTEIIFVQ